MVIFVPPGKEGGTISTSIGASLVTSGYRNAATKHVPLLEDWGLREAGATEFLEDFIPQGIVPIKGTFGSQYEIGHYPVILGSLIL